MLLDFSILLYFCDTVSYSISNKQKFTKIQFQTNKFTLLFQARISIYWHKFGKGFTDKRSRRMSFNRRRNDSRYARTRGVVRYNVCVMLNADYMLVTLSYYD